MSHVIDFKLRQKCILLEAEKFHKMTSIFSQNDDFFSNLTIDSLKNVNLLSLQQQLLLSQLEIIHVIYGPTAKN